MKREGSSSLVQSPIALQDQLAIQLLSYGAPSAARAGSAPYRFSVCWFDLSRR